ncbi:MAG: hypothetical protein IH916_11820 [Acidobacteria bacterium]|nr:hypothetical protein [Acidobacteriota bacterium]
MFIAHYGVALAAKRVAPHTSLGMLFLAAQFIDLLWPVFLLLGFEHVRIDPGNTIITPLDFYDYPITHSLLGVIGWSLALGLFYFAARRYSRGAWVVGAGVLSHWVLDAVVHRPDLPLIPGSKTYIGFGLWNSLAGTVVVELALFGLGLALYLHCTVALDRTGRYGLWSLVALLVALWAANILGPPPPSEKVIAFAGLGLWLFIPWAYWIDRRRQPAANSS